MLDYLVAIGLGTLVFIFFMLVFLRRDSQGQRGSRLSGCQHHHSDQGCDRCRSTSTTSIQPHMPDKGGK